ncbi:ComEC/Rec2 family competence protein [Streptomyces sp. WZ-12]|uniref:ComEC/Rec2 family competence protein n=1 Tax=Streptomyces sp. WZ-12 TaxID=3030210 RepID=UPI0023816555|nr:ComEC/Rec2 family competence protein [Streptomyces sp. WZ-12]
MTSAGEGATSPRNAVASTDGGPAKDATVGSTTAEGAADTARNAPADLRLVGPAVAAWAAAAVALGAPGGAVAVGCTVAVVLAVFALWRAGALRVLALGTSARSRAVGAEDEGRGGPASGRFARGRGPRRGRAAGALVALAAVLLCAAAAAASAALHAADVRRGPLPTLAQRYAQLTVELELTGDPRLTRPKVRGSQRTPPALVFTADAVRTTAPDGTVTAARTPVLAVVQQHETKGAKGVKSAGKAGEAGAGRSADGGGGGLAPEWRRLLPSTRIRVTARAAPALMAADRTAAVLRVTAAGPPAVVAPPSALQRLAGKLRAGLREATDGLRPDARALLPGLVVGDISRVPADLDDAFRATDLTHLLAVSGSNLTIVLTVLIGPPHLAGQAERRGLARRLRLSLRGTALVGGALALGFVVVCRPDPSVLRAAACGLITLLAIGTGRRRTLLPALAAAVLLLILYDPWLARRYGFLLSVLATGALLLLAPRWSAALQRRRVPSRLAEVIAAAAAAQAVCAPVIVVIAARVGLVGVPCNLLAELAVTPATILGFAALAVAPVALPVAKLLAWCAGWPAEWIAGVARTGAELPGAEVEWTGGWWGGLTLAVVTVVLLAVGRRVLRRRWLSVLCALAVVLAVFRPAPLTRVLTGWPPPDWRVVACNVGQGDGLVLAAGDGTALVVDAGPEPRAIDRCLTELGVHQIPLLVLTHFHADHVDGLPGVLRGRSVGAIETTTLQEPYSQAKFVRAVATEAKVPVIRAAPGERRHLGALTWEVLWPTAPSLPKAGAGQPGPSLPDGGEFSGPNDASVALLVRTEGLTVLLLGDLEPPAQQALLAAHPELAAVDVLKVAHHGSAYQDPELMQRLIPRLALVSCGAGNPYGHPAPRTIAALRARGTLVLRTDTDGAIAVVGTSGKLSAVVGGRRPRGRSGGGGGRGVGSRTGTGTGYRPGCRSRSRSRRRSSRRGGRWAQQSRPMQRRRLIHTETAGTPATTSASATPRAPVTTSASATPRAPATLRRPLRQRRPMHQRRWRDDTGRGRISDGRGHRGCLPPADIR